MLKCIVKMNRRVFKIGVDDVFFDNGVVVQCVTQTYYAGDWCNAYPVLAQKVYKQWLKEGALYTTPELQDECQKKYGQMSKVALYKVDVAKLSELGYAVVEVQ